MAITLGNIMKKAVLFVLVTFLVSGCLSSEDLHEINDRAKRENQENALTEIVNLEKENLEFKKRAYNSPELLLQRAHVQHPGYNCSYNANVKIVKCVAPDNSNTYLINESDLKIK